MPRTPAGPRSTADRLLNLPTGSDLRQMREQLSRVERQVEKLSKQLADSERPARTTPRKRTPND